MQLLAFESIVGEITLDKASLGKLVNAWLERRRQKIEVFFLPPYAPEYNLDEYLNHALKLSVHSGSLSYTAVDISYKIQSFMRMLQHKPSFVSAFSDTLAFPTFLYLLK